MSDNSEQTQTQTEVTSSEQMVGLIPMQSEGSVGIELIGADTTEEDFFGNQAIELNGERHVIVSQAQDPETGEILLVLRGENGDHIAIQSEALSSMVQASGGEGIQVAVVSQTDETSLTLTSDTSALSPSISSSDLSTTLAVLPSIIANIPSQTQTTTAPTNVVQAIDTPRVSQEEQPSISTTTPAVPKLESDQTTETPLDSMAGTSSAKETEISVKEINDEEKTLKVEDMTSKSETEGTETKTETIISEEKCEVKVETELKAPEDIITTISETKISENILKTNNSLEIEEKKTEAIEISSSIAVEEKTSIATTTASEPMITTTTSEPLVSETVAEPIVTSIASESLGTTPASDALVTTTASEALVTTTSSEALVTTIASEALVTASEPTITTTASEVLLTGIPSEVLVTESVSETILMTTASETLVTATVSESIISTTASEALMATTVGTSIDSTSEVGFGNTAVIQVQDSGSGTSLEQLMANAMLTSDGNYVFMAQTEDGQMTGLPSELNLSDVINAGTASGQTFLIETPEGLVACTAASNEDGAIQLIPTDAGDIESAVISSTQSSGSLTENQLIQAISGGQMALTLTSNSSGVLELTPVSTSHNQTPAPKPARGGRNSRTPKPKPVQTISSMGQTLLLTETTVTDSPTVPTKSPTPASARSRGGRGGRGGRGNTSNNSTVNSNTTLSTNVSQMKTNAKSVLPTTEAMKASIANSMSVDTSAPGPSQLAASRRTYSKKSNIVWITPEPSHGAASAAFTTVAGLSSKPNTTPKPTPNTNNSFLTKTTPQTTSQSSRVRTPSPTKTIAQIPQTTTSVVTISKPIVSTTSSPKPIIATTTANKSTAQPVASPKPIASTGSTNTKMVTASKTTAMKTTPQSSVPSKVQSPNLSIKTTPMSKTETTAKTTIRVSDITATKTVATPLAPKAMATKTVATLPSNTRTKASVSKAGASTVESPTPSAKSITSTPMANKTTVVSTTGLTEPSKTTISSTKPTTPTTTVASITKPITMSSTTKQVSTPPPVAEKGSKSVVTKTPNSSSAKSNVSTPVSVKETKTNDSSVKAVVSTPIAVKSSATSVVTSVEEVNPKTVVSADLVPKTVPTEKTSSTRSVETRHSARLSPSKTSKIETNLESNKEIVSKAKAPQTATEPEVSKVDTSAQMKETKELKNNLVLESEAKTVKKSEIEINNKEVTTPLANKSTEKSGKKLENEVQKTDTKEENKSVRKSRRNSKNTTIVEEMKKESKSVNEMKSTETEVKETKEMKEMKETKETPKEKPIETAVESVSTRRTSRKREVSANTNIAKNDSSEVVAEVTTPVVSEPVQTPTEPIKTGPGRVTRASSGKKPELKTPTVEEKESKTTKEISKSEPESKVETKVETKVSNDLEKVAENTKSESKSTPVVVEPVVTNTTETATPSRSVKKRVQFEIKEKTEEPAVPTVTKSEETATKSAEVSAPALRPRRSLRSSTPQTPNKAKTAIETNKTVVENENKPEVETNDKTPQRVSTRKRKEVPITPAIEPEVPQTKSPKKSAIKSNTNAVKSTVNVEKSVDSIDSPSTGRLRDRKSKNIKRIEPRIPLKETIRHSIETSDPLGRLNRKKSLIQSYIDENEWQEKEDNLRRKTISSLSDLRSPNECYDYSTNECSFYVRHQSASLTPKQGTGNYLCQKCGFHTTRINNLVVHHRDQCSYIKNAVIQQWQSELQKRVRPTDALDSASTSVSKNKRRKTETNNESNNSFGKHFDDSDDDSEEERIDDKNRNNEKLDQNPTISDIDAMLMGSDDEDLLSIDTIENPKREFGFSEDDIVWVDTNSTHWPALVSKLFPKEKKVLIKLIDSPWAKKSLKISVGSIEQFDSAEVNRKYLRDGKKTSNGDILVKAVQKAEEFLRKKCLGSDLSSAKFFDQIDSDLSEANVDEDDRLTAGVSNDELTNNNKETTKTSNESLPESASHSTGTDESDGEVLDKLPESNEAIAEWKEKRRQQNQKLLQCIKEAKVETHLLGVYRESIASQRHQKFKSGSESEKNQLKHVPWFGPIDDEEQQEEIYDYCSQLFKSNFKTDGSFDTVAYIFEVWVPEAIVKAISRVRRIELKDSESVFAKGVILSKSEREELTKEIQKEAEKQMSNTSSD